MTGRELERLLRRLGFQEDARDHHVFTLYVGGRKVAETKTSYGTSHRTIGDRLGATMARQLHISRQFLYDLVRGDKTPDDYFAELRRRGIID